MYTKRGITERYRCSGRSVCRTRVVTHKSAEVDVLHALGGVEEGDDDSRDQHRRDQLACHRAVPATWGKRDQSRTASYASPTGRARPQ